MKNIHILPADKPSRLSINYQTNLLQLGLENRMFHDNINIYITSDEYIGLSYYLDGNLVRKGVVDDKDYWEVRKDYKKIILTTDQDLIRDGIQSINDEFLEWFIKNPSCEEVEIKPLLSNNGRALFGYKIIIPKEEPCDNCNNEVCCCIIRKQETLEEAAQKFYPPTTTDFICSPKLVRDGFIAGAKWQQEQEKITTDDAYNEGFENGKRWQQERSYSEEDLKLLLKKFKKDIINSTELDDDFETLVCDIETNKWFEQFKKK